MSLDREIAGFFPQLKRQVNGQRLVYLDSAATTLKPRAVIEAVRMSLENETANVHRGAHWLSDQATEKFEKVRDALRDFVGAEQSSEIIFTRGTTEGINLLARSLGGTILNEGDEIILSQMEHHSNIVPWQLIAAEKKVKVRFIPVTADGSLDFDQFKAMLNPKVRIVSLVQLSNALGTVNSLEKFFAEARAHGAVTVVDAAQSASVMKLDVRALGADFLVASGHKMFGPTGIGFLYGKQMWLEKLPPYHGGGSMISEVTEERTEFLAPPHRFEAGTPAIAEVMGLGAALEFIRSLGYENILRHERQITNAVEDGLSALGGIDRIGTSPNHSHVVSFLLEGTHPSDIGSILDEQGIAIRTGHHCCQPLMRRFGIPGTARASFSVYTSEEDVEDFLDGVSKAKELLT